MFDLLEVQEVEFCLTQLHRGWIQGSSLWITMVEVYCC